MDKSDLVISYLNLRRLIGVIALLHPVVLYVGGLVLFSLPLQESMSHYYHTGMRNVFVGADVATGVFLLCYRGYGLQDRIVASLAGLSAILVAFFPIALEGEFSEAMLLASKIHVAAALLFLLCLAYFCLVLFVRSGEGLELSQKKKRHNLIYRICGINIVMVIIAVITYGEISAVHEYFAATPFIFFLELIAFWSFGLAWLVKGRALGAA